MGNPHRIEAVFLQNSDTPFFRIPEFASAQHAMIVMNAPATKQDTLTVDGQALFSVPFQLTDAKGNHPLVRIRSDQDRVEKGFFCTPQLGLRHLQNARLSAGYSFLSLVNIHRYVAVLSRLYVHPHFCGMDLNRFHMYLRNVILLPDEQMHRPIKPGAGIPAAIRLQRIVHLYPDVVFSRFRKIRNIYIKGGISIPMGTGELSVYIDLTVLIDALKVQRHGFSKHGSVQFKGLSICILAAGEIAGIDTVPASAVPLFQQHGIVGKVNGHRRFALLAKCPVSTKIQGHFIAPLSFLSIF